MNQIVITAVGPDRPGLVKALTGKLAEAGGNVADSRMVNLRGQFAVILLAQVPEAAVDRVCAAVQDAGKSVGLTVSIARGSAAAPPRPGIPFKLRAYAMDQPGIVHRITHLLDQHGVNIEELATRLEPGSYTGTPLFTMTLTMTVPPDVKVARLRSDLAALCDTLNCDVEIDPI
jgi:glycine cleavage system transcriptional repressor